MEEQIIKTSEPYFGEIDNLQPNFPAKPSEDNHFYHEINWPIQIFPKILFLSPIAEHFYTFINLYQLDE
jgi:hypothetical protein